MSWLNLRCRSTGLICGAPASAGVELRMNAVPATSKATSEPLRTLSNIWNPPSAIILPHQAEGVKVEGNRGQGSPDGGDER